MKLIQFFVSRFRLTDSPSLSYIVVSIAGVICYWLPRFKGLFCGHNNQHSSEASWKSKKMTIDRCEPDLKGHQSDFLFERYADSIIDVTWVQNLLLQVCYQGGKCRAGLDSRMEDFLNILLQKKLIPDDIIIQRQRF